MSIALLTEEERPIGLLLNEVGNMSDLLDGATMRKFDDLIEEVFELAGATEHGAPRIFWSAVRQ